VLANHLITLDGQVIGGWKRTDSKPNARSPIESTLSIKLTAAQHKALMAEQTRLRAFLHSAT
jgi:hypothetical protein